MSHRDDRSYIEDAVRAIDAVTVFVAGIGREAFLEDAKTQAAVMHELTILGEACGGVSAATRSAHPEVPWRQAAALRNRLIHGYFDVSLDIVDHVESDLQGLRSRLAEIAEGL